MQGTSELTDAALFLANMSTIFIGDNVGLLGQTAIPVPVVSCPDAFAPELEIRANGEVLGQTSTLLDVGAVAAQQIEANMPWILARAAIRRTAKAVAAKAAQDTADHSNNDPGVGMLLGILTNLALTAGEKADTRNWTSLPARFQVARLEMPEGTHDFDLGAGMHAMVARRLRQGQLHRRAATRSVEGRCVLVDAYSSAPDRGSPEAPPEAAAEPTPELRRLQTASVVPDPNPAHGTRAPRQGRLRHGAFGRHRPRACGSRSRRGRRLALTGNAAFDGPAAGSRAADVPEAIALRADTTDPKAMQTRSTRRARTSGASTCASPTRGAGRPSSRCCTRLRSSASATTSARTSWARSGRRARSSARWPRKARATDGAARGLLMIGSTAGRFGEKGHAEYAAGKAGLDGCCVSLKNEIVELDPYATREPDRARLDRHAHGAAGAAGPGRDRARRAHDAAAPAGPRAGRRARRALPGLAAAARHVSGEVITVAGGMEGRSLWDATRSTRTRSGAASGRRAVTERQRAARRARRGTLQEARGDRRRALARSR
jgi:hypothetical protein